MECAGAIFFSIQHSHKCEIMPSQTLKHVEIEKVSDKPTYNISLEKS